MRLERGEKPYTAFCVLESENDRAIDDRTVEEIDVPAKNKDEARVRAQEELERDYEDGMIIHSIVESTSIMPMMFY